MNKFIQVLKTKEIRRRLLFVLLMLVIIRVASQIPLPNVNSEFFKNYFAGSGNDAFRFLNAFTGGGFEKFSIFALSITPYITASIIVQLLTIAFPSLEEWTRDGEEGRKKLTNLTRYLTVGLSLFESVAMCIGFGNQLLVNKTPLDYISVIAALTGGSCILMWFGDRIDEYGIGNGVSIILLVNILSRVPQDMITLYDNFVKGRTIAKSAVAWAVIVAVIIGVTVLTVVVNGAERRIAFYRVRARYPRQTVFRLDCLPGRPRTRYRAGVRSGKKAVPSRNASGTVSAADLRFCFSFCIERPIRANRLV